MIVISGILLLVAVVLLVIGLFHHPLAWVYASIAVSVLSFVLAGHEPLEVGKALNAEGIAVRAGHHCAQPILRRMGLEATVRPSFAFYNTFDEIDVFLDAVRRIAEGGAPRS